MVMVISTTHCDVWLIKFNPEIDKENNLQLSKLAKIASFDNLICLIDREEK
jgi:hypothetical protein